jgi:hypothetical protein
MGGRDGVQLGLAPFLGRHLPAHELGVQEDAVEVDADDAAALGQRPDLLVLEVAEVR